MKHCFVIPVYNHPHYLAALLSHLNSFELPITMVNEPQPWQESPT